MTQSPIQSHQFDGRGLFFKAFAAGFIMLGTTCVEATEPVAEFTKEQIKAIQLPKPLKDNARALDEGFKGILGEKFLGWRAILCAIPNNNPAMGALCAVLCVTRGKTFDDDTAFKAMLTERLNACGIGANFVTEQADWIQSFWDAYKKPDKSPTWALPFVIAQLQTVAALDGLHPKCKEVLDYAVSSLSAAQLLGEAVGAAEALKEVGKKVRAGCC